MVRELDLGIEGDERRDRIVCRRRGREVARDRPARADLRCADLGTRLDERKRVLAERGRSQDVVVGDQGAEGQPAGARRDEAQLVLERGQVDQPRGRLDATPKFDHEIGAAGDDPSSRVSVGECV